MKRWATVLILVGASGALWWGLRERGIYRGDLIDAMAQWQHGRISLDRTIQIAKDAGVSRLALFVRRPLEDPGAVAELENRNAPFLVAGTPKYFFDPEKAGAREVDLTIAQVRTGRYRFVGEILSRHAEKTNYWPQREAPERLLSPDSPVLRRMLTGLKSRLPLILHWEFHRFDEDFPRYKNLFRTYPDQIFVIPHFGFGDAGQVRKVLEENANVVFTFSKRLERYDVFRDPSINALIGHSIVGSDGRFLPEWRKLILDYPRRMLFATDAHLESRWDSYPKSVKAARKALGDLPPDVAYALAAGNASDLFQLGKPNILILSICSWKHSHLAEFGYSRDATPELSRWAQAAHVFSNALNDKSWSNVSGFLRELTPEYLERVGYEPIGQWTEYDRWKQKIGDLPPYYFRLPQSSRHTRDQNFVDDLQTVERRIRAPRRQPFLLEIHSKFLHLPYNPPLYHQDARVGGVGGSGIPPFRFLGKKSLTLFNEYFQHPENYPGKTSLWLSLGRYESQMKQVLAHPAVSEAVRTGAYKTDSPGTNWIGWAMNPDLVGEWKRSPGFVDDLQLLKDLYDSRMHWHDWATGPILKLYNEPLLRRNTLLIVTGDHGEEFFESGGFLHGDSVKDVALRFPLFIKTPGQLEKAVHSSQFYQGRILDLVKTIMEDGQVDLSRFLSNKPSDTVFSRNCSGSVRAVRKANRWKLVIDTSTNSRALFDLRDDPREQRNVLEKWPNMAAQLEEDLLAWDGQGGNRWLGGCDQEAD